MKKIIFIALAAILAGFAISCQKEESVSEKTDTVQYTFNITVKDQVGFDSDASTKGALPPSYKTTWENKDKIFLFFKPTEGSLLEDTYATLTYNGSSWDGAVTGTTSLGKAGTLSAVYVYNLGSSVEPEFSTDKWTIATGNTFYNCQTEVSYTVSGSVISATLNLIAPTDFVRFSVYSASGALTCDKVKGWKDIAIGSDLAVSNVTCTGYMDGFTNSGTPNFKEYYGRIVSGTSLKGVSCKFSVVKSGKVYERTATPESDARSFNINDWTEAEGKLPGLFKISKGSDDKEGTADDVQVRFSQGNLYAKNEGTEGSADWKWHFYDEQYQYNSLSTGNSRTATADDTEIDLFTWGYDATKSIVPTGKATDNVSTTSGNLSQAQDWGCTIGDGNTWRTLTSDEWRYLFAYDPGNYKFIEDHPRRQLFKYGVTVCGKLNCVVLLPDGWKWEGAVGTSWQSEYNETTTDVKWSTMEAAGAVCLPAAGLRDGFNVDYVGDFGYYWSSTAIDEYCAYFVNFSSGSVFPCDNISRYKGLSVRLITDVN